MRTAIALRPEMTPAVMADLERRDHIIRLGAHHHDLPAQASQTFDRPRYRSGEVSGPHLPPSVTVNCVPFVDFATRPDNEGFLLIGDFDMKPLVLVPALMGRAELERKIRDDMVAADFIFLRVEWDDSAVSFFTMLTDVPRTEAVVAVEGTAPMFYVAESRDLPNDLIDYGSYEFAVGCD